MNGYLFDSNVIIEVLRGNRKILQRLLQVDFDHSFVSEITVIEVLYGTYLSNNPEREKEKAQRLLSQFNVLPLVGAEDIVCEIKYDLRRKGTPIEDADIMIAATALANGLTLVTNNKKHFSRVEGLLFEDWKAETKQYNV